MPATAQLSKADRRTVARLAAEKPVSTDAITGLFNRAKQDFYALYPAATGMDWSYGTTKINNLTLPGNLLPLQNSKDLVDEVTGSQHVMVMKGTRLAGTRVGVHVHESGGLTFALKGKGTITDYVEGFQNTSNPKGSYYFMPANIPMSAANLSLKDITLMDIFVTPIGSPAITIIEPGYPGFNPPTNA